MLERDHEARKDSCSAYVLNKRERECNSVQSYTLLNCLTSTDLKGHSSAQNFTVNILENVKSGTPGKAM